MQYATANRVVGHAYRKKFIPTPQRELLHSPVWWNDIHTRGQGSNMGKCRPGASRKVPPHSQWRNQRFEPGRGDFWRGPVSHSVGMQ